MNLQPNAGGRLVLLGSEGVEIGFEAVWRRVLGDTRQTVDLLPIASYAPGLIFQTRLELIESMVMDYGSSSAAPVRV